MKIGSKFALTFLVFAVFLAVIAYVEQQYTRHITDTFKSLETDTTPALTSLLEALSATRRASIKAIEYATHGQAEDLDKTHQSLQQLKTALDTHASLHRNSEAVLIAKIESLHHTFKRKVKDYLRIAQAQPARRASSEAAMSNARKALIKAIYPMINKQYKRLHSTAQNTARQLDQATSLQLYAMLLISFLAVIGAVVLARAITQPLNKLNLAAEQISQGYLDVDIDIQSKDEIGQLAQRFRQMASSLKQQKTQLQQSEKRFSSAFYGLPTPMGLLDLDSGIRIDCNDAYCQHLGLERDQIIGHSYLRDDLWQDPALQQQTIRDIIDNQYVYNLTTQIRVGSGEIKTFLFSAARLDISGKNLAIVSLLDISDRIHLEQRLQQENEKLRQTEHKLEHAQRIAHLGNWEYDIVNNIVYWSAETYRIFGLDPAHDIASFEAFLAVIHPDDRARLQQTFEHSVANNLPYEIEHRLLLPDGSIKYLYGKGETQYDEQGAPLRTLGTVQDITEQKQSEAISRRMNRMFEHSVEEIYIFSGETQKFLQVSQGALDNLGYSQQEIEQLTPLDITQGLTQTDILQILTPLIEGKQRLRIFETTHLRKDGSTYPVEVRLQYTLEDVAPVFLAIIVDLTERKKAESELEKHRHQLEALVEQRTAEIRQQARIIDQTHDSVIVVDLEGNITSFNGGAEKLFRMQADDVIGKPILVLYPQGSAEFLQQRIVEPVLQKGNHEIEVRLQRADGDIFPAHLSLSMLHDEQGQPTGIVGYSIDLSESKRRELELDQLSRKLQASNKELEAFSYSVSHDLRSPLRSIDGFSLAILEDYGERLDDSGKDYLNRVRKAAQRMGTLIDELLELSRVNRAEMRIQRLDLNAMAQHSFDEFCAQQPERQVQLVMDEDMHLQGDKRLCRIIIDNLLGNAWKFTAQQEKAVITIKSLEDNPQVIYISDNGVGFDMRHADKLFGAFQRLHQTAEFPGTGVGLATVQRIIHRHGGRIWAESKPGQGATFFFTLDPDA